MAHIKLIKVTNGSLQILPGNFKSDAEAMASIKHDGEYLFIEAHNLIAPNKVHQPAKEAAQPAAEGEPLVSSPKKKKHLDEEVVEDSKVVSPKRPAKKKK